MGSGRSLSSEERAVEIALLKTEMSQRATSVRTDRSKTAIQHAFGGNASNKTNSKVG